MNAPLIRLYREYLSETGSEVAAAILAVGSANAVDDAPGGSFLTPPQVAKQLGITPETVIGWIKSGQLKASNIGQGNARPRYRIRQSAVDDLLAARQPEPPRKSKAKVKADNSFKLYAA